jgi:hypothetical protein
MNSNPDKRRSPTVRFDPKEYRGLIFGERLRRENGVDQVVAHINDLAQSSATDLVRAMRRGEAYFGRPWDSVLVSEVDVRYFDEEDSMVTPISFVPWGDKLTIVVDFLIDQPDDDEERQKEKIAQALTPMLSRQNMEVLESWPDGNWINPPWLWHTQIGFNTRGRILDKIYGVGQDVIALMTAMDGGPLTRETAGDLVRGGHAQVLIGQNESHWLDVKGQHYDLQTDHGQISLAHSVARFCNSEDGGLVVVGMTTKRIPGGEEIRAVNPMPRDGRMAKRYQQTLEKRLFPPPDNLSIEMIPVGANEMIMLVDVPPQPEELKPFLVYGAIIDGRIEGAFISIVRRRGESSIPITAPMIHSTLAAGRGLLRRGEIPR